MNHKKNQPSKYRKQVLIERYCQERLMFGFTTKEGSCYYDDKGWLREQETPEELLPFLGKHNPNFLIKLRLETVKSYMEKDANKDTTMREALNWIVKQYTLCTNYSLGIYNPYLHNDLNALIKYKINQFIKDKPFYKDLEPVKFYEYEWLETTNRGAIMSAIIGKYPVLYSYDIKSAYPAILSSQMRIPIRCGIKKKILDSEFQSYHYEKYSIGLYHCKITGKSKWFPKNKNNIYTHNQLLLARKEGLDIKMLENGSYNAILYPSRQLGVKDFKSCTVPSCEIFGEYMNEIFILKNKHKDCILFKRLISGAWGAVVEHLWYYFKAYGGEEAVIPDGYELVKLEHERDLCCVDVNNCYKTELARLKPFLITQQHSVMLPILNKYDDIIVRVNNDGILTTQRIEEFDNNPQEMGKMVFEKEYHKCTINHVNDITYHCSKCDMLLKRKDKHDC